MSETAMDITRLIYFSENQIDPAFGSVTAQLASVLSTSNRNNQAANLTGALVFDSQWFLQVLEGDRARVWQTLKRIEEDDRHSGVVIVEAGVVASRLFGNWWMGLAKRDKGTEQEFAPYLQNGRFDPREMKAAAILELMVSLSRCGLSRKLAKAA